MKYSQNLLSILFMSSLTQFSCFSQAQELNPAVNVNSQQTNVLQVFISPPQRYIKWDSPKKLAKTFLMGWLKSHQLNPLPRKKTAMGHGMVHVNCQDETNQRQEFWTGITGNGDTENDLVLKEHVGMKVIFMEYDNGYIQKESEVKETLSAYRGRLEKNPKGKTVRLKPLFLEFDLTPKECSQAAAFYNAFKSRSFIEPQPVDVRPRLDDQHKLYFGLTLEPWEMYKENILNKNSKSKALGGGCTSYASAFLKATGHYDDQFDQVFKREIQASDVHMGSSDNPIRLTSILFGSKAKSWAHDFSSSQLLKFYDPEMMYGFFDGLTACHHNPEAISDCRSDVSSFLDRYNSHETEITVTEPYKGHNYTNTIHGIHLKRK